MSFDYIRETRELAADLLALMSFFDAHDMPEVLLRDSSDKINDDSSIKSDHSFDFENYVQILREYSFISVSQDTKVSKCTVWYKQRSRIGLISTKTKTSGNLNLSKIFFTCFPTAILCITGENAAHSTSISEGHTFNARSPKKCYKTPQDAQELVTKSKTEYERILGSDIHAQFPVLCFKLRIIHSKGELVMPKRHFPNYLKRCERIFGDDHVIPLRAKEDLAEIYYNQSRLQDAENLWEQVLHIRKINLGEQHSNTLAPKSNLGLALLAEVLEAEKKNHPDDHPSILAAKSSISSAYIEQGKLKEAEEMDFIY
ncbi:TPR-like protein [Penicillium angulare]|uniref:TPR-like protein n=1 Tax=Penicillium angulare TaxID=116970 RepID=UPI002541EF45|nr:TPR-like protein [Penicillium angulare]KAJ5291186.1 TPR-like protein [Penicillium angulare]